MNMNEGLDNLISEVGTILGTELPVQRRLITKARGITLPR